MRDEKLKLASDTSKQVQGTDPTHGTKLPRDTRRPAPSPSKVAKHAAVAVRHRLPPSPSAEA